VTLNYALFLLEFVFKLSFPWSPIFPVDVSQPAYALPSGYSIYFVFLIPLLLHRLSFGASTREKALAGALLFVTFSGVVFLGSRAALFSVVVALLLLLSQYLPLLKPRRLGFLFAVAGLAVALALLLIPQQYWVRQKTVVETKTDASVAMRISYVQAAWQYFRERPLFGYGPGSFKELYAVSPYAIQFANKQTGYVRYAHNTFLEVLVGTGLAGFLLFGVAVAASIRNFARAASLRWQRGDHAGALLDRAYLTAFLVNLFYFFFISYFFMKTFWIFLALSQIALNRARAGSPPAPPAA
jgi:O-antigen ligase